MCTVGGVQENRGSHAPPVLVCFLALWLSPAQMSSRRFDGSGLPEVRRHWVLTEATIPRDLAQSSSLVLFFWSLLASLPDAKRCFRVWYILFLIDVQDQSDHYM
mmetsp:Transcript_28013/g.73963  ORF Transcript_28013/g.73963 Transcript_28013/m.73963 type:complete len:104 (-) Transcript_28013:45-356(-)